MSSTAETTITQAAIEGQAQPERTRYEHSDSPLADLLERPALAVPAVNIFDFSTPDNAMKAADMLAKSDFVPKDYRGKPGNILVAVSMGAEVGLKPLQALQNIAVINGRPGLWGDALPALIRVHPEFEYMDEWEENETAYCVIKRRNQPAQTRTFSAEDAKRAGLAGGNVHKSYPARMRQMRARGFCSRDVFPDALKGLGVAEEIASIPREDYSDVDSGGATSRTEAIKQKLRKVDEPELTESEKAGVHSYLADIKAAKTREDLDGLGQALKDESEAVQNAVRSAYANKLERVKSDEGK
ncbi:MAG: hypothetical protein AAFN78_00915 [Pseudomonadota bacterium]